MGRSRSTTVVGLTIEAGRIAAAQVAVNGAVVVQAGAVAELAPGVVRDGEVADTEALASALRDLWREHRGLDKRVRIGVANARIVVRTLYLPPIEKASDLATAVQFQAKDEIPMPLEDAVLDFHATGIVDTPAGPRQRVVLVAARRDMLVDVLTAARAAGLKPIGVDLSAFGMVRALQPAGEDTGPELFASVGGITNLAIAEDGVCGFTRVAGSGLESLAVELAERRGLTLEHARMWLHHVGLAEDVRRRSTATSRSSPTRARSSPPACAASPARSAAPWTSTTRRPAARTAVRRVVLTGPAVAVAGFASQRSSASSASRSRSASSPAPRATNLSRLDAACLTVAAGLAVEEAPSTHEGRQPHPTGRARAPWHARPAHRPALGAYVVLAALVVAVLMGAAVAYTGRQISERSGRPRAHRAARARCGGQGGGARVLHRLRGAQPRARRHAAAASSTGASTGRTGCARSRASCRPTSTLISLVGTTSPTAAVEGAGAGGALRSALPRAGDRPHRLREEPERASPGCSLGCARSTASSASTLSSSEKTDSASLSDTDCRTNERMPQFQLTVFFRRRRASCPPPPRRPRRRPPRRPTASREAPK